VTAEPLPSLWLARARRVEEVEIAVVGGGIVGLSTAWWLARAGKRPVLLEADAVAAHASGRNAGFLLTGSAEPFLRLAAEVGEEPARRFWEVSRDNRELLRAEILDRRKVECDFLPEGSWLAALAGAEQEEELRQSAERLAALGFELEWREARDVRRASGSDRLGGAIFQPQDAGLDPVALCRGLAGLLVAAGCEVRAGARAFGLGRGPGPAGGGVELRLAGGMVRAERAVIALNAYSPALLPHLAGTIQPVRGQILATAPAPRDFHGVWYMNDGYEYARQLGDGTFLLGGCRWTARDQEVGYLEAPTATVQAALDRFRAEAFPRFAHLPVVRRWAGTMALTADGLPLIGEVPGVPGALYAAGLNGHGMSLGFAIGRHLARRLLGDREPPLFGVSG
jgi:glycine/D-amino acid oxidase-like deaminating enzyme